jgi:hypothetical protein
VSGGGVYEEKGIGARELMKGYWFNLKNAAGVRQFQPRVVSTLGKRKIEGKR